MPARFDQAELKAGGFAALFLLAFLVAAFPVAYCDTLPLFDYPNHLARMHILAEADRSALLQQFYAVRWLPIPNLAMDLILPWLSRVVPLAWAAKLFILASFLLIAGGVAWLYRLHAGRWSPWPCLAFLFLYSRSFLWGFLNYLFGVGLALVAFAAWIALRERSPALRLGVAMVLAVALFFAHLQALGIYGLLVAGYELGLLARSGRLWSRAASRALLGVALPFAIPALLLFLGPHGDETGGLSFGRPLRKLDLLFSVFDNYNRPFDIACFVGVVGVLAILYWRRAIVVAPALRLPLAFLGLAYLMMPTGIFSAYGADHRMPLILALALIAASDAPGLRSRWRYRLAAGAALLFLARMAVIGASWAHSDETYGALLKSFDAIPKGGRVAVAYAPDAINFVPTPLVHLPTFAIIERDAFVPTLFAYPTQQPVALTPAFRSLADRLPPALLWTVLVEGRAVPDGSFETALREYDCVILIGRRPFTVRETAWLRPVDVFPDFQLFRVAH